MMETIIQQLASYSETIFMFLWLPVLIWTALAAFGWTVLRVLPNLHPQYHYRGRLAIILSLPAGLIALCAIQIIEKNWYTESAAATLKFVTLSSPVDFQTVTVIADRIEIIHWTEWAFVIGLMILMAGTFLFAFRFLKQWLGLKRLKESLHLNRIETLHNLDKENRRIATDFNRGIYLAFSEVDIVPVTFGFRQPVILLPESLRNNSVKMNLAIRHELTHITENDFISHSVVLLTQLLFWYHPLVHLYKNELADYREMRCDSMVLSEGDVSRKKYASLLLELMPMPVINKELSINMAQETSNLKKRIQMIVQNNLNKPVPKRASLAIFAIALLGTAIAMACTDLQTQQIFDNEELNLLTDVDYDGTRGYHQILIFMSDEEQAKRHLNEITQLQNLHPGHIMSIEVLKGDAAIERYGDRGADGVIQINTNLSEESYNRVLATLGMNQVDLSLNNPYESEEIFVVVEQMPELIGGLESIQREMRYPETARRAGIEGRVYVQFVVDEEGNVAYPRVTRGIGGGADEEALRVVSQAKFRPAMQRGMPVKVHYTLPIFFRLPESERNQTIQPATSVNIENPTVLERELKAEIQRTGNIINGRILDSESNQPLAGANIIIDGSSIGASTNHEGRFTLELTENESLAIIVSYIGYSRTQINL